jgi:hypothetical protein
MALTVLADEIRESAARAMHEPVEVVLLVPGAVRRSLK